MFSTPYKYFFMVAKTENFHKASEELFVSQPAISKQIQLLEQTLGYTLFKRTTRNVRLTVEGRLLYHALQECNFIMENVQETIRYRIESKALAVRSGSASCTAGTRIISTCPLFRISSKNTRTSGCFTSGTDTASWYSSCRRTCLT